jgi:hypothetical protein
VVLRERVARAIFAAAWPGHRWEGVPIDQLEQWGAIADAAIAAGVGPRTNAQMASQVEALADELRDKTRESIDRGRGLPRADYSWFEGRLRGMLEQGGQ